MHIPNDDTQNHLFCRQTWLFLFVSLTTWGQWILKGWFIKLILTNNCIYRRKNFVYDHWGCTITSIYRPLSYPFRSLIFCNNKHLRIWQYAVVMLPHKEEGLNVNYENCKVSQNLTSHQLFDINFLSSCYVKSNKKDNIHNSEA